MPMELVTIDFVKLERGTGGNQYILVIVDHFSRFAQAYATRNKSSAAVAKKLYNDFVLRFGLPARILSDQGGEFESKTIRALNHLVGIQKSRTTPYHPQSNGACERMNQTLLKMLRSLPEEDKSRWPEKLNKMIHAYNCSPHSSTGYSPFFLMFGREPKLPIDMLVTISASAENESRQTYNDFVRKWRKQMEEAYAIASNNSTKGKFVDKQRWDSKVSLTQLEEGDRVLVQNKKQKEGPQKLQSFWEPHIYVITKVMDEHGVVYKCQREDQSHLTRTLHRNMLLPVGINFENKSQAHHKPLTRNAVIVPTEPVHNVPLSTIEENEEDIEFQIEPITVTVQEVPETVLMGEDSLSEVQAQAGASDSLSEVQAQAGASNIEIPTEPVASTTQEVIDEATVITSTSEIGQTDSQTQESIDASLTGQEDQSEPVADIPEPETEISNNDVISQAGASGEVSRLLDEDSVQYDSSEHDLDEEDESEIELQSSEGYSRSNSDSEPQEQIQTSRVRNPPKRLVYDTMGQPSYTTEQ